MEWLRKKLGRPVEVTVTEESFEPPLFTFGHRTELLKLWNSYIRSCDEAGGDHHLADEVCLKLFGIFCKSFVSTFNSTEFVHCRSEYRIGAETTTVREDEGTDNDRLRVPAVREEFGLDTDQRLSFFVNCLHSCIKKLSLHIVDHINGLNDNGLVTMSLQEGLLGHTRALLCTYAIIVRDSDVISFTASLGLIDAVLELTLALSQPLNYLLREHIHSHKIADSKCLSDSFSLNAQKEISDDNDNAFVAEAIQRYLEITVECAFSVLCRVIDPFMLWQQYVSSWDRKLFISKLNNTDAAADHGNHEKFLRCLLDVLCSLNAYCSRVGFLRRGQSALQERALHSVGSMLFTSRHSHRHFINFGGFEVVSDVLGWKPAFSLRKELSPPDLATLLSSILLLEFRSQLLAWNLLWASTIVSNILHRRLHDLNIFEKLIDFFLWVAVYSPRMVAPTHVYHGLDSFPLSEPFMLSDNAPPFNDRDDPEKWPEALETRMECGRDNDLLQSLLKAVSYDTACPGTDTESVVPPHWEYLRHVSNTVVNPPVTPFDYFFKGTDTECFRGHCRELDLIFRMIYSTCVFSRPIENTFEIVFENDAKTARSADLGVVLNYDMTDVLARVYDFSARDIEDNRAARNFLLTTSRDINFFTIEFLSRHCQFGGTRSLLSWKQDDITNWVDILTQPFFCPNTSWLSLNPSNILSRLPKSEDPTTTKKLAVAVAELHNNVIALIVFSSSMLGSKNRSQCSKFVELIRLHIADPSVVVLLVSSLIKILVNNCDATQSALLSCDGLPLITELLQHYSTAWNDDRSRSSIERQRAFISSAALAEIFFSSSQSNLLAFANNPGATVSLLSLVLDCTLPLWVSHWVVALVVRAVESFQHPSSECLHRLLTVYISTLNAVGKQGLDTSHSEYYSSHRYSRELILLYGIQCMFRSSTSSHSSDLEALVRCTVWSEALRITFRSCSIASELIGLLKYAAKGPTPATEDLICGVLRSLTAIMAGSREVKVAFKTDVGYEVLLQALLEATHGNVPNYLLTELVRFSMDGKCIDYGPQTIQNAHAAMLPFKLFSRITDDLRLKLLDTFILLLERSCSNRALCCDQGITGMLLSFLPTLCCDHHDVNNDASKCTTEVVAHWVLVDRLIHLIEITCSHSINTTDCKIMFRLLRPTTCGKRHHYFLRLLQAMESMTRKVGPSIFLDLAGANGGGGIVLPSLANLPESGFSFFTWIRLEEDSPKVVNTSVDSESNRHRIYNSGQRLYSFFSESGIGFEAYITPEGSIGVAVVDEVTTNSSSVMSNFYLNGISHRNGDVAFAITTVQMGSFTFEPGRWYSIAITHVPPRRMSWAQAEVKLFIDGSLRHRAPLKYPSSNIHFEYSSVACSLTRSNLRRTRPELMSNSLHGQLAVITLFSIALSSSQVKAIHALGWDYRGLFLSSDSAHHQIANCSLFDGSLSSRVLVSYGGRAIDEQGRLIGRIGTDRIFFDKSSARLCGQRCLTTALTDALSSLGGVQLLFILIPQMNADVNVCAALYREQKTVSANETELLPKFLKLLSAVLHGRTRNQDDVAASDGFFVLGYLFSHLHPHHLSLEFVRAVVDLCSLPFDRNELTEEARNGLLLDGRLWLRACAATHRALAKIVCDLEGQCIQYVLDRLRTFYWYTAESNHSLGAGSDGRNLDIVDVQGIRRFYLEFISLRLMTANATDVIAVNLFFVSCQDAKQLVEVLEIVENILNQAPPVTFAVYFLKSWTEMEVFFALMQCPDEHVRVHTLQLLTKLLCLQRSLPNEKSRPSLSVDDLMFQSLALLQYHVDFRLTERLAAGFLGLLLEHPLPVSEFDNIYFATSQVSTTTGVFSHAPVIIHAGVFFLLVRLASISTAVPQVALKTLRELWVLVDKNPDNAASLMKIPTLNRSLLSLVNTQDAVFAPNGRLHEMADAILDIILAVIYYSCSVDRSAWKRVEEFILITRTMKQLSASCRQFLCRQLLIKLIIRAIDDLHSSDSSNDILTPLSHSLVNPVMMANLVHIMLLVEECTSFDFCVDMKNESLQDLMTQDAPVTSCVNHLDRETGLWSDAELVEKLFQIADLLGLSWSNSFGSFEILGNSTYGTKNHLRRGGMLRVVTHMALLCTKQRYTAIVLEGVRRIYLLLHERMDSDSDRILHMLGHLDEAFHLQLHWREIFGNSSVVDIENMHATSSLVDINQNLSSIMSLMKFLLRKWRPMLQSTLRSSINPRSTVLSEAVSYILNDVSLSIWPALEQPVGASLLRSRIVVMRQRYKRLTAEARMVDRITVESALHHETNELRIRLRQLESMLDKANSPFPCVHDRDIEEFSNYITSTEWKVSMTTRVVPAMALCDAENCESFVPTIHKRYMRKFTSLLGTEKRELNRISTSCQRIMGNMNTRNAEMVVAEDKRRSNNFRIEEFRHNRSLKRWHALSEFYTGERGAFSSDWRKDHVKAKYWRLDPMETRLRERPKQVPFSNGHDHADASRRRDEGDMVRQRSRFISEDNNDGKIMIAKGLEGEDNIVYDDAPSLSLSADVLENEGRDGNILHCYDIDGDGVENIVFSCPAFLVELMTISDGTLEISTEHLIFYSNSNYGYTDGEEEVTLYYKWPLAVIREVHLRRYLLRRSALEIFLTDQTNYFLNFTKKDRNTVFQKLISLCPKLIYAFSRSPSELLRKSGLTQKWINRRISNFDYLMQLNTIAGRTYNDLNQYPVFPWVISDYTSHDIDLSDPAVYRDLSKPIGALNEERLERYRERFETFEDPSGVIDKFFYGTHYSTAASVLFYLLRVEPFSTLHVQLQSGKFDHASRQFHSVASTWSSCLKNMSDVKELIPEFFYMPEIFRNELGFDLGTFPSTGEQLGDVLLPPWAATPEDFVRINRLALESEYVSEHLHEWIDLIFGYAQKGPAAVEACNVFYYVTYEGAVDLDTIIDADERASIEAQISNFGQTPVQLLSKPHPKRLPLPLLILLSSPVRLHHHYSRGAMMSMAYQWVAALSQCHP